MLLKYLIVIIAALIYSGIASKSDESDLNEETDAIVTEPLSNSISFRLPNNTIPLHYDVWLSSEIHVPNFDFNGIVTINVRVVEDSSDIVVNSKQLNIINVDLLDSNRTVVQHGVNFQLHPDFEMLSIHPVRRLFANEEYHVRINYRGVMRTDNFGFYRAYYTDDNGNRIWYATTQFQATDFRHAAPSYDEPRYRTSFTTMIRHHPRFRAVSNMPVQSIFTEPSTGFIVTTFQRVPSMQTYLNAYLISDFHYAEDLTVVPPQRIYAKPSSIRDREYELALRESPKIMLGCEQYYGLNYSFPKMDQVAITQFPAGAMEDWGLVSYREPLLLFNPNFGRTIDVDNIIRIIAHEFMHQFIGNMVSPEWWSYIWLNEGTATLDQYLIPHIVYPHERYDDSFISDQMQFVFEIDSNPNVRAMTHYVEYPPAILALFFDSIAYPKAGSVLHTFRHALGESTWQKSMHNYLVTRYDNFANPSHLYAAIQMAVDEDFPVQNRPNVAALMRPWELQSGFPVLTVTRTNDTITITQERFYFNPNLRSANLWPIPINYVVASNPDFRFSTPDAWMVGARTITINNANATKRWTQNDWMIFNIRQNYYCRINYDLNLWRLIIEQLNGGGESFSQIHLRNRASLIDDAFNLARAEKINFGILFGVMDYLWKETDRHPWVAANRASISLNRWLSGSVAYEQYQDFVRRNINAMFTRLGVQWREQEHRFDRHGRIIAMVLGCQAQLPECLQETNQELIASINNGRRIAPEYVPTIYCQGMRIGNGLLFVQMQNRLFRSTVQAERNNIITGMGCSQNPDLLFVFLSLAITPDIPLSLAEKQRILTAPAPHGEEALRVMVDFTRFNYNIINELSGTLLNTILTNIANHIGSESLFDNFVNLLDHLLRNGAITQINFNTQRTNARVNLNWQDLNMQPIIDFFHERQVPVPNGEIIL